MSVATQARAVDPTAGSRIKRWWIWVVLFGLLVALGFAALGRGENIRLDALNSQPMGARALAQVLGDHGVSVTPINRRGSLAAHRPNGSATLVVFDNGTLTMSAATVVADVADRYSHLVVMGNSDYVFDALDLPLEASFSGGFDTQGCDDPMVGQTHRVGSPGLALRVVGEGMTTCFGLQSTGWLLASREAANGQPRIDVYANEEAFMNSEILDQDNAVLGLRLLSRDPSLVWFAPAPSEVSDGDAPAQLPTYLPEWYAPLVVLGILTALAAMLWRGRRLGRLVVEPLPVTIRTTETTRSRGRLYVAAADRQHSLAALQAGTRRRLAKRLSVPPGAPESVLVNAVAGVSGWPAQHVADLLFTVAAPGDEEFVARANALVKLEEECR